MKIPIGLLWDSYGTPEGFLKDDDANGAPMGLLKASEKDEGAYATPVGLLKNSKRMRMLMGLLWAS